jgi:phosphate transport system permease protein
MSADNQMQASQKRSFTGRERRKQTRWTVRAADVMSKIFITVGGIGTIVAVLLVFVFLAYVVLPLFAKARVTKRTEYATPWTTGGPVHVAVD